MEWNGFKKAGRPKSEVISNLRFTTLNGKYLNKGNWSREALLSQINKDSSGTSDFRLLTSDNLNISTKLTVELNIKD